MEKRQGQLDRVLISELHEFAEFVHEIDSERFLLVVHVFVLDDIEIMSNEEVAVGGLVEFEGVNDVSVRQRVALYHTRLRG